jgi:hypothetical protein
MVSHPLRDAPSDGLPVRLSDDTSHAGRNARAPKKERSEQTNRAVEMSAAE